MLAILTWPALLWIAIAQMAGRVDLSKGGKVTWAFVIVFLPYVDATTYLIVQAFRSGVIALPSFPSTILSPSARD